MIRRVLIAGFLFLVLTCRGQDTPEEESSLYRSAFGDKYTEALAYLSGQSWIPETLHARGISPTFAEAIVFPEVIRYSAIRDMVEMHGLITLYVQYGSAYSDFSVGRFQMKPSFALQVEKDAKLLTASKEAILNSLDTSDTPKARLERIQRLNSETWQIQYLIGFIDIMDHIYGNTFSADIAGKLKFFATAYNCGYTKPEPVIRKKMKEKHFHTALLRSDVCYNYGDIALDFYNQKKDSHFE
jgi:hypothetical protein